ncbi:hypothetical protein [uncultured Campylobacter sp.]|nr:hypothetical protein [uncultured Campylobacter sp.]
MKLALGFCHEILRLKFKWQGEIRLKFYSANSASSPYAKVRSK